MAKAGGSDWLVRWALLSLPVFAAGVFTFFHVNAAVKEFTEPIIDECNSRTESIENPVWKFVEWFTCFITPFFRAVLRSEEGLLIWAILCAYAGVAGGFFAVEASRLGARSPLSWYPLWMLLFQVLGVSIVFPTLWLPLYFLIGLSGKNDESALKCKISKYRVFGIWFVHIISFTVTAVVLFPWLDALLNLGIAAVQWVPVILPLLLLLFPVFASSDRSQGHDAVIRMNFFFAGVSFVLHVAGALAVAANPEILWKLLRLFKDHDGGDSCIYFLLVDLIVFHLALLYHVLIEDGPAVLAAVVAATPVIGPAAPLSLYYAYREDRIWRKALAAEGGGVVKGKQKRL